MINSLQPLDPRAGSGFGPRMELRPRPRPGPWTRTEPGARFSKAPETFRARKAIFSSSVSKDEEVYTPDTTCMKRTSFHIKNLLIK